MIQGDPLLPGHGVPGGAPGVGSAAASDVAGEMAHMRKSTWRWWVQHRRARLGTSVLPSAAHSTT